MPIVKQISIKSATSATGYDTREIGAKGQNIEVGYDASGKIILDVDAQTPITTKQLTEVLQDAEKNISDLDDNKAPDNHAWSDSDSGVNHGLADETHYGHIKTGNGLTNNSGKVSVAYGTTSNTACEGNDVRLSDARKNPNAVTFSDGITNTSYDGSSAKTITAATIGAAPSEHTTVNATSSILGHVKTGTGITNNSGTISVSYGTAAGTACQGNDARLSDARTPKSHASSTASTYGAGNATNFGHVKVSDSYTTVDSAATAANSVAASAYALQSAYNELKSKGSVGNEYKDITTDFDNGTFSANLDKYNPGNYIKKEYDGVTYVAVLADFNTFYNPGRNDYANIQSNHWTSIIFGFEAGKMNKTNTTDGGYKGSAMHTWLMGDATAAVKNAFGTSHLVAHRCLLSIGTYSASDTTHGFSWEWVSDVYLVLPSEAQLGYRGWSDLGWSTGEAYKTLDIFQNESFMSVFGRNYGQSNNNFNTSNAWLRDISAIKPSMAFCYAYYYGSASYLNGASSTFGRFPLAILK